MKRLFSLVLCATLILSCCPVVHLQASAATTEGYYTYEVSNGEVTITDVDSSISGDIVIPSTLGGHPVTSIGHYAFRYCASMTSITIPDGVTSIGNYAFAECSGLTSITISNSVISIGYYAFYSCTSLAGITIPDSVTGIGDGVFYSCVNLNAVIIGKGIQSISNRAFSYCTGLTNITIPNSVTSVGDSAFSDCTNLNRVQIPDSVTSMGDNAFYGCTALTTVIIGEGIQSISNSAFANCTGLTSITIPSAVTSVGNAASRNCDNLAIVYYAGSKEKWEMISFGDNNEPLSDASVRYNHRHNYSKYAIVQYCDQLGYIEYKCIHDETTYHVTAPALGHLMESEGVITPPTCTEQGYTSISCTRCDKTEKTNVVPALGHSYQGAICTECGDASNTVSSITVQALPVAVGEELDLGRLVVTVTRKNGATEAVTEGYTVSGFDSSTSGKKTATVTYEGCTADFEVVVMAESDSVVDDSGNIYETLNDAIKEVVKDGKLTIVKDVTENITVDKSVSLDLNGFSINGTVTVKDGCIVYGMDMQTDDYTIKDDKGYGKIKKVVLEGSGKMMGLPEESALADDGYLMVKEDDGISFHRVNLQLKYMTLRATAAGVYFKSDFAGDELVAANVKQFGVALSVYKTPAADNMETHCKYSKFTRFNAGKQDEDTTSTLLKGVMKPSNTYAVNNRNANMPIYGRAYILTNDGEYIFGASASRTFREQVEGADALWADLSEEQQTALLEMYEQFTDVMKSWNLTNLKNAIA